MAMTPCLLFLGDIGGVELALLLLILPVLFIIHFIPSFIARKRPDFLLILVINILAGWSLIGWGIALYLALRKSTSSVLVTSVADELTKLHSLRDQGVITAAEFERQKQMLLN